MKYNITYLLAALCAFIGVACSQLEPDAPQPDPANRVIRVNASIGKQDDGLRLIQKDLNSSNVFVLWEKGQFQINIALRQGDLVSLIKNLEVKEVSDDGHYATFDIVLPQEYDLEKPFDVYGIIGARLKEKNGKILVGVEAHSLYSLDAYSPNRDDLVPVWFHAANVSMTSPKINADFEHLGALVVATIINKTDKPLRTAGVAIQAHDASAKAFYYKGALPFEGNTTLPYLNILDLDAEPEEILSEVAYPEITIQPQDVVSAGFWLMPNGNALPETDLIVYDADQRKAIVSTSSRPARATALEKGRAYNVYAEWDGTNLNLLPEAPERSLPADNPYMEITSSLEKGETFYMNLFIENAEDAKDAWIDLNNNGVREKGEYINFYSKELDGYHQAYTLQSSTFRVYGKIKNLSAPNNQISSLDLSHNPDLEILFVQDNALESIDLGANAGLKRLNLERNKLTELVLPVKSQLQELYVGHNKLTQVDLSKQKQLYVYDLDSNELESIEVTTCPSLFVASISNNKLNKAMIDKVYHSLPTVGQPYYDWMYWIYVNNNPGAATADHSIAKKKNWRVYVEDANTDNASPHYTPSTIYRYIQSLQ